jgi:hypothetical protein
VGLAILATTRPYEGLILAVPVGGALLWRARRAPGSHSVALLPTALLASATVAGIGVYNRSVTGAR